MDLDVSLRKSIVPPYLGGESMDLLNYKCKHNFVLYLLLGNGRCKALALLGDKLLDLLLYENLIKSGLTNEGEMTQERSLCVANTNLAECAQRLMTPSLVGEKSFNRLSSHERGTVLEAYIGGLFEKDGFVITDRVRRSVHEILSILRGLVAEREDITASEFKANTTLKKSKTSLLELFQKRGVLQASNFFHTVSIGAKAWVPPFVSTFKPTFNLLYCDLPETGSIVGDPCETKKEAEENVALKVLLFFQEREKEVKTIRGVSCDDDVPSSSTMPTSANRECVIRGRERASNIMAMSHTANCLNAENAAGSYQHYNHHPQRVIDTTLEEGEEVEDPSDAIAQTIDEGKVIKQEIDRRMKQRYGESKKRKYFEMTSTCQNRK